MSAVCQDLMTAQCIMWPYIAMIRTRRAAGRHYRCSSQTYKTFTLSIALANRLLISCTAEGRRLRQSVSQIGQSRWSFSQIGQVG